jgi:hypothetical protein
LWIWLQVVELTGRCRRLETWQLHAVCANFNQCDRFGSFQSAVDTAHGDLGVYFSEA